MADMVASPLASVHALKKRLMCHTSVLFARNITGMVASPRRATAASKSPPFLDGGDSSAAAGAAYISSATRASTDNGVAAALARHVIIDRKGREPSLGCELLACRTIREWCARCRKIPDLRRSAGWASPPFEGRFHARSTEICRLSHRSRASVASSCTISRCCTSRQSAVTITRTAQLSAPAAWRQPPTHR